MRILIIILCASVFSFTAFCQVLEVSVEDTAQEPGIAATTYAYYFSTAFDLYEQGKFPKAEKYFRKAYSKQKNNEAAEYIYYCILSQGYENEAAVFRKKHSDLIRRWPDAKKRFESIHLDIGPRISATSNAGNILYADAGVFCKLADNIKLWQTATYLQQDDNLGNYKQYGSHSALGFYLNKGWSLTPSLNYFYTDYNSIYSETVPVSYGADYVNEKNIYSYRTNASKITTYTAPGYSHYLNLSLSITKRVHSFTFEIEPALHYSVDKSNTVYRYFSKGTTDSFINSVYTGTTPYTDSGYGTSNATDKLSVGQLGVSVLYKWPAFKQAISTKFAFYYLMDEDKNKAVAWHFYSLIKLNKNIWIHLDWLNKGVLPWMLNSEGLYFNFTDRIDSRGGISVQLWPFKRLSPMLTYQYEQDTRLQDNAKLKYNSFYLTLKYKL